MTESKAEWMRCSPGGRAKVRGSSFQVAGGSPGWQVAGETALKGEPETGANERLGAVQRWNQISGGRWQLRVAGGGKTLEAQRPRGMVEQKCETFRHPATRHLGLPPAT